MRKADVETFLAENQDLLVGAGLIVLQTTSGAKFIGDAMEMTDYVIKIRRYKKSLGASPSEDKRVPRGYIATISLLSIDSLYAIEATNKDD